MRAERADRNHRQKGGGVFASASRGNAGFIAIRTRRKESLLTFRRKAALIRVSLTSLTENLPIVSDTPEN